MNEHATTAAQETNPRRFIMRTGSTINDPRTGYLWGRRIPLGGLTIIFSRPGVGKSTLACDIAAHVTQGKAFVDDSPCPQGKVLYLKGEGSDVAIRDRMNNANADPSAWILAGRADGDGDAMIDLATDAAPLRDALDANPGTKLIVVDTLDSMFPSMRMIDNGNIRRCLWPLQEIAEQRKVAVVVLAHTNKGGYADPLDRLSGGRAIGGAARAVWYLGKLDPEVDESYMAPVKVNDFIPATTISYAIQGHTPDSPGHIAWRGGDFSEVSAWTLDQPPSRSNVTSKADACEAWMRDLLANGPVQVSEFNRQASEKGFGQKVRSKARAAIGATSRPATGAPGLPFYLCLNAQMPPSMTAMDQENGRALSYPPSDP